MPTFKVGIIGTGRPWRQPGATGFGMAHLHAAGYEASPDAEIVAAADINPTNLNAFCEEHDLPLMCAHCTREYVKAGRNDDRR